MKFYGISRNKFYSIKLRFMNYILKYFRDEWTKQNVLTVDAY